MYLSDSSRQAFIFSLVQNPAAHPSLKQYGSTSPPSARNKLKLEYLQSKPFRFPLASFRNCAHLRTLTLSRDVTPTARYFHSRDLAFFCLDFYSGDRASDLGRVHTREILALPDGNGFVFRHMFGKTLRGRSVKLFAIKSCPDPVICPVSKDPTTLLSGSTIAAARQPIPQATLVGQQYSERNDLRGFQLAFPD